jgi:hypothetical protein
MAHSQREITFLLVEGESDQSALTRFLIEACCEILVCHRKSNVLRAVSLLDSDKEEGFLAIVDADFDHVERRLSSSVNCILTEFHDLEVMLLSSSAFDRILMELGSQTKLRDFQEASGRPIRESLFDAAAPLGLLRLANEREIWGLKFDGFQYARRIDVNSLVVDIEHVIVALVQRSGCGIKADQVKDGYKAIAETSLDRLQICCGHDVVDVLSVALRNLVGTCDVCDVRPELLERELRLAFDFEDFSSTGLYASIRQWETRNPSFLVLRPTGIQ